MPAALTVPWNKGRITQQAVVFAIVLGALGFFCRQLGGWNAAAVAAMAAALILFLGYAGRLLLVLGRGAALELGPEGLTVNTLSRPRRIVWGEIASCSAVPAKGRRFEHLALHLCDGEELTVNGMYLGLPAQEIAQAVTAWTKEAPRG